MGPHLARTDHPRLSGNSHPLNASCTVAVFACKGRFPHHPPLRPMASIGRYRGPLPSSFFPRHRPSTVDYRLSFSPPTSDLRPPAFSQSPVISHLPSSFAAVRRLPTAVFSLRPPDIEPGSASAAGGHGGPPYVAIHEWSAVGRRSSSSAAVRRPRSAVFLSSVVRGRSSAFLNGHPSSVIVFRRRPRSAVCGLSFPCHRPWTVDHRLFSPAATLTRGVSGE